MHIKGIDLKEKDRSYSIREENLEAQVAKEEERAKQLEEYRVYVADQAVYREGSEGSWDL
ncbi:MAG: hypothetical protein ACLR8P_05450 [Clostridium fessum]